MKSTYSLELLVNTVCKDNAEVDTVHKALKDALHVYQWQYQKASERAFRDVKKSVSNAVKIVVEQLNALGYHQLAEDIPEALADDEDILTRSKFMTKATNLMKSSLLRSINKDRYTRDFAKIMRDAFSEHCEEYPLREVPGHIQEELDNIGWDDNYPYEIHK